MQQLGWIKIKQDIDQIVYCNGDKTITIRLCKVWSGLHQFSLYAKAKQLNAQLAERVNTYPNLYKKEYSLLENESFIITVTLLGLALFVYMVTI